MLTHSVHPYVEAYEINHEELQQNCLSFSLVSWMEYVRPMLSKVQ